MQAALFEFLSTKTTQVVLCENDNEAEELAQITLYKGLKTFVLPDFRASKGDDLRAFSKELFDICKVLSEYHKENEAKILISPVRTLLHKLPSAKNLSPLVLKKGQRLNLNAFKDDLLRLGYNLVDMVQDKGEASLRGEIIDIFSIADELPVRLLLFDDEIESIRHFNLQSQKSIPKELEFSELCPFLSSLSQNEFTRLNEKIAEFKENLLIKDINSLGFWFVEGFFDYLSLDFVAIKKFDENEFEQDISFINAKIIPEPQTYKNLQSVYNKDFFTFHKDKKITLLAANEALLKMQEIILSPNINFIKSPLRVNLSSQNELIISLNKKSKVKRIKKPSLIIDELKIGDFITHQDYGVGKFSGLERIKISGAMREFVALLYQNEDKLLLPVENLYMIDKYLGSTNAIPQLDRLGKGSFLKLKERLKEKLFVIAQGIVELAAKRALIKAPKFRLENQLEFRTSAGFDYTQDQEKACEDIFKDLQSGVPMDRLLSADVGFGKTEVAMNGILAVLRSGFCAFFFVPTTLLSHQHYKTLSKRFAPFDIRVKKLDRFTSSKEKSEIQALLSDKKPFVLIGTHALLGVKCENLGLIIIDEEHKFGVKQKEKLKEFSQNSHILSMSATPIPRSLNQALSSIKSYSSIQTPPQNRLSVRTFVKHSDDKLIKEVILRELRRGGQIFYIHNHIASIEEAKAHLQGLLPHLRVLVLHSKIDAKSTEEQMLKFEEKGYDILLCTSIVESGIDLPNVNTIIVENAERFGMADLHQLRGRVGRSDRQGYCYFFVAENLSVEAKKRLVSLESNSFLGAGSILAYHDLEIRGGGNLLGSEQSGHIEQIGYNLYLKMLEEQIAILSKKELKNTEKIDLKLNINAFLNSDLISEDRLRLELYRRLSKCESVNEVYEIGGEIEDRFGALDSYTKQFLDLIIIKILANKDYKAISNYEANISLTPKEGEKILLKAPSKDDDDILETVLIFLRKDKK